MKPLVEAANDAIEESESVEESCETKHSGDSCEMTYHGKKIRTVEELLIDSEVDLRIWEVVESTVNNWEVAGRHRKRDGLWKTGLRQIKVKLRRKAPKFIQEAIIDLLKDIKPLYLPRSPKRPKQNRVLMEAGIHDHHFAKLCYGVETGTNYDLRIAEKEFRNAIDEMVRYARWFNVEKIIFPVGSDLVHYNSEEKTTANDTPMATSADDRYTRVFRLVCENIQYATEAFLAIAPTELVYIAGNHDRTIAWHVTEWISALFKNVPDLTVFNSPTHRKYISYGNSLLGYTHGDEIPHDKLPGLMAQEAPSLWAASKYRSWRTGHYHKKKATKYTVGDTHNGVEVYIFPSLCGTDSWHYRRGYVGSARMAEVHFWSESDGPAAVFYVQAKEPRIPLAN